MAPDAPDMPLNEWRRSVAWTDSDALAPWGSGSWASPFSGRSWAGTVAPPPLALLLGIKLAVIERGRMVVRMPADEHLSNPLGSIHGGAIAALFDTALNCATPPAASAPHACCSAYRQPRGAADKPSSAA